MSDKDINPLLKNAIQENAATTDFSSPRDDSPVHPEPPFATRRMNSEASEGRSGGIGEGESQSEGREAQQVKFLQSVAKETNFVFLFGGALRGKTVITSSIVNFLSSAESEGDLTPFRLKRDSSNTAPDPGRALFNKIRRVFADQRFPGRTTLVGDKEPIYLNVRFTPKPMLDADLLSLTFLEMPGEDLEKVDTPDGGYGELPSRINAFLKANGLALAFILVTEPSKALGDDQLMASFIDYIQELNKRFERSRFLLLLTKWDSYEGELNPEQFVAENMRLTFGKLQDPRHSIASFSIGEVTELDGKPFLNKFEPTYSKAVVNWLYEEFKGKPLYRARSWQKILRGIKRFL